MRVHEAQHSGTLGLVHSARPPPQRACPHSSLLIHNHSLRTPPALVLTPLPPAPHSHLAPRASGALAPGTLLGRAAGEADWERDDDDAEPKWGEVSPAPLADRCLCCFDVYGLQNHVLSLLCCPCLEKPCQDRPCLAYLIAGWPAEQRGATTPAPVPMVFASLAGTCRLCVALHCWLLSPVLGRVPPLVDVAAAVAAAAAPSLSPGG